MIERAAARGIHVVIASGRSFHALPREVMECEGVEYAISLNGAAIHRISDGACLYEAIMSTETVEGILKIMEDADGACMEAFCHGHSYTQQSYVNDPARGMATPGALEYVLKTRILVEDIRAFCKEHIDELSGMDCSGSNLEEMARLKHRFETEVPGLYITSSVPQLLEFSKAGGGKGTGLCKLGEILGVGREDMIAFGDGDNDKEMLVYAGVGVAMANAGESCRAAADVMTLSNDECGVARYLEKLPELQ